MSVSIEWAPKNFILFRGSEQPRQAHQTHLVLNAFMADPTSELSGSDLIDAIGLASGLEDANAECGVSIFFDIRPVTRRHSGSFRVVHSARRVASIFAAAPVLLGSIETVATQNTS
jgi:hypothetical protein